MSFIAAPRRQMQAIRALRRLAARVGPGLVELSALAIVVAGVTTLGAWAADWSIWVILGGGVGGGCLYWSLKEPPPA